MRKISFFNSFLFVIFLIFSFWLMQKSLYFNEKKSTYMIARNEVGDFGLHLSLIQSFILGNNFPPQPPFFPGVPLTYHYGFDFLIGLLGKFGMPIVFAFNGVSSISFAILLYILYAFPQMLFSKRDKRIGIISVLLFIFHSGFTFVGFFSKHTLFSQETWKYLWHLPDYFYKGPFDGSIISIFFTLNVFLNQRHLIFASMICMSILYMVVSFVQKKQPLKWYFLITLGVVISLLSKVHTLLFFALICILFCYFLFNRKYKDMFFLLSPAGIISLFLLKDTFLYASAHSFLNPGFLIPKPLTIQNFIWFWIMNLGISCIMIPIGFFIAQKKQKIFFLSFFSLFILGNTFQFSYRVEHNHSLFNLFIMLSNFYIAYLLIFLWDKKIWNKFFVLVLFLTLTASGMIDIMAVKNDFHYPFVTAPRNMFISWIEKKTPTDAIFLAKEDILDPIELSGRRNYFGSSYYTSVMGYQSTERQKNAGEFFSMQNRNTLQKAMKEHISFLVIPISMKNFPHIVNKNFLSQTLQVVYQDNNVTVYKL
jgi:hypothetical protein